MAELVMVVLHCSKCEKGTPTLDRSLARLWRKKHKRECDDRMVRRSYIVMGTRAYAPDERAFLVKGWTLATKRRSPKVNEILHAI